MDDPPTTNAATPASDRELVADIRGGQGQAEAALYQKYSAKVYYLALRYSRSPHDAEDVRAETFLRVLQAIRGDHLRSPDALPAFILGTARNVVHEVAQRARRAGITTEPENLDLAIPSHEEHFLDQEVQSAVNRTIAGLRPRERDLLRLHYYEELPTEEIARRLGIAPERVRLVKSRALKRFGECYRKQAAPKSGQNPDTEGG